MKKVFAACILFLILAGFGQLCLAQQGKSEYQVAFEPKKTPQLISYWPGDGNANDVVGPNNGKLHGASFTTGKFGQAFHFNGKDQFVSAGTKNLPTGKNDRTLMLWAKIDRIVAEESFFAGYGQFGQFNDVYELFTDTVNKNLSLPAFSQWGSGTDSPLPIQLNKWYHFAVSSHGNIATLYVNGQPMGVSNARINTAADTEFFIGRIPGEFGDGNLPDGGRRLSGAVDDIKIFDGSFSACEIASIYNSNK